MKKIFSEEKNPKKIHENLDCLLGLKKEKVLPKVTNDCKSLADEFGNHFEEKIETISLSFTTEASQEPLRTTLTVNSKFGEFKELNINDFRKMMHKVKNTYCENDPFPISDVKEAKNFDQLQEFYFEIVSKSLTQATFPNSEKLACIKPVYKEKGDKDNLGSYRPISNLSYLSKIIEKVVHEQTWEHLKQLNIMPYDQSAYRENHSTETTVCAINNDMTEIITNGKCGILVMLDLSAAFDTVEHKLLLEDLRAVGIEKNVYRWYKSYLENRKITVIISNTRSEIKNLTRGVPQGSILGPLLFSIYTIELSKILEKHKVKFTLYADDTQFYFPLN